MYERTSESRPRPTSIEDQDKTDITGRLCDLHIRMRFNKYDAMAYRETHQEETTVIIRGYYSV